KPFVVVGVNSARKEEFADIDRTFFDSEHKVLEEMFECAIGAAKGKNIGVFCSSNAVVATVYDLLKDVQRKEDFVLLPFVGEGRKEKEMKEVARKFNAEFENALARQSRAGEEINYSDHSVIELFKSFGERDETSIILGVMGGTLSEGVDYYGKQMEMVVTVGLPYPSSAAEMELNRYKENYFFMQKGNRQLGEDLAYKQDAFRKLAQSIGRAHRRMSDRGVIICADERLVAVKAVQSMGESRHEYLSIDNARKNMCLLQRPIRTFRRNIVFTNAANCNSKAEHRSLKKYISSGIAGEDDFISFEEMAEQINDFYREKR
ncbi:hypothetical protein JXC34_06230, partial [Candidatus Woesearchaeota archaeon]|nr:hypothetical protein [Candidatus Woesearchaeota archaeon]